MNSDLSRQDGHECQGMCWRPVRIERNITKILENDRIDVTAGQGVRILQHPIEDRAEPECIPGRTGQGRYVQHTDHRFAPGLECIPYTNCHHVSKPRAGTQCTALWQNLSATRPISSGSARYDAVVTA